MAKYIEKCFTLDDIIDYSKQAELTHGILHMKVKLIDPNKKGDIVANFSCLLDKYIDIINTRCVARVILSDEELIKYKFQPKKLSYDCYDTTELWSGILRINHMTRQTQFNQNNIRVFRQSIFEVINEILILEKDNMKTNTYKVYR